MAVIDKDGNIFDVTPSVGWVPGAVILGDTGIGMSVRGEQFWLDKTRANQIRPRSRPRYTLTPSLVFKGDTPMMALGTPGGDNQDQTILQALLSVLEFWDDWYPNLHAALDVPCTNTAFHRVRSATRSRVQQAQRQGDVPDAGRYRSPARATASDRLRPLVWGCATAVMIDRDWQSIRRAIAP
jgi:gamma-glutamyltranspeptidase/glutathione hydrolase